jgi:hypothetical protein
MKIFDQLVALQCAIAEQVAHMAQGGGVDRVPFGKRAAPSFAWCLDGLDPSSTPACRIGSFMVA